jgi:hypothetical protein
VRFRSSATIEAPIAGQFGLGNTTVRVIGEHLSGLRLSFHADAVFFDNFLPRVVPCARILISDANGKQVELSGIQSTFDVQDVQVPVTILAAGCSGRKAVEENQSLDFTLKLSGVVFNP